MWIIFTISNMGQTLCHIGCLSFSLGEIGNLVWEAWNNSWVTYRRSITPTGATGITLPSQYMNTLISLAKLVIWVTINKGITCCPPIIGVVWFFRDGRDGKPWLWPYSLAQLTIFIDWVILLLGNAIKIEIISKRKMKTEEIKKAYCTCIL